LNQPHCSPPLVRQAQPRTLRTCCSCAYRQLPAPLNQAAESCVQAPRPAIRVPWCADATCATLHRCQQDSPAASPSSWRFPNHCPKYCCLHLSQGGIHAHGPTSRRRASICYPCPPTFLQPWHADSCSSPPKTVWPFPFSRRHHAALPVMMAHHQTSQPSVWQEHSRQTYSQQVWQTLQQGPLQMTAKRRCSSLFLAAPPPAAAFHALAPPALSSVPFLDQRRALHYHPQSHSHRSTARVRTASQTFCERILQIP